MDFFSWPALQLTELPKALPVRRAVWGKVHGMRTDYRWIAATTDFEGKSKEIEYAISFGNEQMPKGFVAWRALNEYYYAIACYPSRAEDADGRSGFLEKQVLEWKRSNDIPAALAMLVCLPKAWTFKDSIWWEERKRPEWEDNNFVLTLNQEPSLEIEEEVLAKTIQRGIDHLSDFVNEETLVNFYANALAGYPLAIPELSQSLSSDALAALLLPLPKDIADKFSLTGWLPVKNAESKELFKNWNAIFCDRQLSLKQYEKTPTKQHVQQAQILTDALFSNDPKLLNSTPKASVATPSPQPQSSDIHLTLWGPSSAGKTVFLAQLDIAASANVRKDPDKKDWQIFPEAQSMNFTDSMREQMRKENRFPKATAVGNIEEIAFTFKKNNINAILKVDDRAGAHFEDYVSLQSKNDKTEMEQYLASTEGFIFIFDPDAEAARLSHQIWSTVQRLGYDNPRPVAICVSKSDLLIKKPEDYKLVTSLAQEVQHEFVKEYLLDKDERLANTIERYSQNYRFFPVSAAGIRYQYGSLEPVVFYDESLKPRICSEDNPLNLLAPFFWVLDEIISIRNIAGQPS